MIIREEYKFQGDPYLAFFIKILIAELIASVNEKIYNGLDKLLNLHNIEIVKLHELVKSKSDKIFKMPSLLRTMAKTILV